MDRIIDVPNLNAENALKFCEKLYSFSPEESEVTVFDFERVRTCDPFAMLIASQAIRKKVNSCNTHDFKARNMNNTYADHMKFFQACQIDRGKNLKEFRGNNRYNCITEYDITKLRQESFDEGEEIQELLERMSRRIARVLSQEIADAESWLSFAIREMLRNIPEHSKSPNMWICSQYWPYYDLAEVGIMDEGVGISGSLTNNFHYKKLIENDSDAILLALEPGVTSSYMNAEYDYISDEWKNSGYGLYLISNMCAMMNADFIIASGNAAVRVMKNQNDIVEKRLVNTHIEGTAIQIRFRPSEIQNCEALRKQIISDGEEKAQQNSNRVHSASKASRGF